MSRIIMQEYSKVLVTLVKGILVTIVRIFCNCRYVGMYMAESKPTVTADVIFLSRSSNISFRQIEQLSPSNVTWNISMAVHIIMVSHSSLPIVVGYGLCRGSSLNASD